MNPETSDYPPDARKRCSRCGFKKPLDAFSRSSCPSHSYGRQGWCKECHSAYQRELAKIVVRR